MATEADLTTYLDDARSALDQESPDTALARRKVALAKTVLAELPNVSSDGTSSSYAQSIQALESAIEDFAGLESGGITSQPLEFGT